MASPQSPHDEAAEAQRRADDPDQELTAVRDLMARLRREIGHDQRLRARVSEQELVLLVEDAVRALWHDSNVKTFIAVLAMRQVREELGMAEEDGSAEPPVVP